MSRTTEAGRVRRRSGAAGARRRLTRTGPLAWLLGGYWVGMCALVVGLVASRAPVPAAAAGVVGLTILVRMAVMGVYVDDRGLRCVSWFVTRRVPYEDVMALRVVGYSGFGNRFSESRMLSMLVVGRSDARPVVLRGTIARAITVTRAMRVVEDAVAPRRADPVATSGRAGSRERSRGGS